MIPSVARFYNATGADRVAVVSAEPSTGLAGGYLIRLARGSQAAKLTKGSVYGPYAEAELPARFQDVVDGLKAEGFLATGVQDALAALHDPSPAVRARAALKLGWRRATEAVTPILAALPAAVDEVCSFMDALGELGDARAIPVLRAQANRKLLSRRRSAVEALRNLGDEEGLAAVNDSARTRLPESVRKVLDSLAPEQTGAEHVKTLADAVLMLDAKERGLALDTLFELHRPRAWRLLSTPVAIAAVRAVLAQVPFDQPNLWRYVKSIHKRAMLRHDYVTFAELSHAIEVQGRQSKGTTATVKSGYDGAQRTVRIFGRRTQQYMRRLCWRYLRLLALHRPERYPSAAAEVLIHYTPDDAKEPRELAGEFADCYLLNRILWGASPRLVLDSRSLRFRFRSAKDAKRTATSREESFPQLWDREPWAYLTLLGAAKLPEVQEFAIAAIEQRHPDLVRQASRDHLLALVRSPLKRAVRLALAELERRFHPDQPDWPLLDQLLADDRPEVREVGERWLRMTARSWTSDVERVIALLAALQPSTRTLAVELVLDALGQQPTLRQSLARRLLDVFRAPPKIEDAEAYVRVAREGVRAELDALLSVSDLVKLITTAWPAAQVVAGDLLGRRSGAVAELGLETLALLAQHEIVTVRGAAHQLLRVAADAQLRDDPSLLLVLVESDWQDTRTLAFELLRERSRSAALGLDGLVGLLDSTRVDVQDMGKELVGKHLATLPKAELATRLIEHPHPNMRRFVLDLVTDHLPAGAESLKALEPFFRAALLDLRPERAVKRGLVELVIARGLRDQQEAEVAVRLLSEVVRIKGRADFERALEGLVRLKLAYPEMVAPVVLDLEDVA